MEIIMNRIVLALVALGPLTLAGCQKAAIDSRVAEISDRLAACCVELKTRATPRVWTRRSPVTA
ncbi:hypothetical protein ASE63_23545 [Bosea sp. Root381]|uniref:hypothetical protein n=1 Tax=Bosea sp. Root381 TaxID=1736524 RepID=UPI0006FBFBD9|nr:hypothetical protein [Bosea sp. Root381]KRE06929.1 hypothetical protein ASE63_23545 [Bosea sp. Root381]